jgi:hypothetical protein
MHLFRSGRPGVRRLILAALAACLAGALLAAPASAGTATTLFDCRKSFTYVENGLQRTGTYTATVTVTQTITNGTLVGMSSRVSRVSMSPSWIREYVTEATWVVGHTVYFSGAGFTGTGAWVSCSTSRTYY